MCSHCGTPLTQQPVTASKSAGEFLTRSTPVQAKTSVMSCCLSPEQMPPSVRLQPCRHISPGCPAPSSLEPWICSAAANAKPRTFTNLLPAASIFRTSLAKRRSGPPRLSVAARTAAMLPDPQMRDGEYKPCQRISNTDYKSVRTVR